MRLLDVLKLKDDAPDRDVLMALNQLLFHCGWREDFDSSFKHKDFSYNIEIEFFENGSASNGVSFDHDKSVDITMFFVMKHVRAMTCYTKDGKSYLVYHVFDCGDDIEEFSKICIAKE